MEVLGTSCVVKIGALGSRLPLGGPLCLIPTEALVTRKSFEKLVSSLGEVLPGKDVARKEPAPDIFHGGVFPGGIDALIRKHPETAELLAGLYQDAEHLGIVPEEQDWWIAQKLSMVVKTDPLLRFKAYPYQEAFLRSNYQIAMLNTANQLGKTYALIYDGLTRCLDRHPYVKYGRPIVAVLGVTTTDLAEINHIPKILELLPMHEVRSWAKTTKSMVQTPLYFHNGSVFHIRTFAQGRSAWQAFTADWLGMDEEAQQEIMNEAYMRIMRNDGIMRLGVTPLELLHGGDERIWYMDWIHEATADGRMETITATMYDGVACGQIPEISLKNAVKQYSVNGELTDEGRVRILGEMILSTGRPVFSSESMRRLGEFIRSQAILPEIGELALRAA